jgi:hypothetical protein
MRRKRLKKRKIFFYECVLEFNYATNQRVCITKLLKSLYPNVQLLPKRLFPAIASLMSGHIEGGVPIPLINYIHRRQCT